MATPCMPTARRALVIMGEHAGEAAVFLADQPADGAGRITKLAVAMRYMVQGGEAGMNELGGSIPSKNTAVCGSPSEPAAPDEEVGTRNSEEARGCRPAQRAAGGAPEG